MSESRDDLLSSARFARDEHGRIGRRHLRRPLQRGTPLAGLANDTELAFRFEFLCEPLHARVELLSACARLRDLCCRRGQLLVRHGEGDVVRDPVRDRHVALTERVQPLRAEHDDHHLIARLCEHDK